jgi:hypothetical protein
MPSGPANPRTPSKATLEKTPRSTNDTRSAFAGDADNPQVLLQSLAAERGRMLTEAEYQQMRQSILDELARGPRYRPFTVFTFGVVSVLLLGATALGVGLWRNDTPGGVVLALAAAACLAVWFFVGWRISQSVRAELRRPLADRLTELDQLRAARLVSEAEFESIRAAILISRQR